MPFPLVPFRSRADLICRAGSYVEPNQNKSYTQQMKDFVTPGNDSGVHAQTQGQEGQGQGVMEQVSGMATGAKDAVANMFTTEQSGNNHEQH